MLTTILESRPSSRSTIDYNEEKFWRGDASVVLWKNMHDPGPEGVYHEILTLEENPEVSARARRRSFHMAVNPAPTDFMGDGDVPPSEELVLDYIQEVMDGLGMGGQPYVVYRHNDIERTHYHVVSTRVQHDGRLVENHYWQYKLMDINNRLSGKYAFVIGQETTPQKGRDQARETTSMPKRFTRGMTDVRAAASRIFEWALSTPFRTAWQFQCLLKSMNIGIRSKRMDGGGTVMYLQGLDDEGRIVKGRGLSDHVMATGGLERIKAAMAANRKEPRKAAPEVPALAAVARWAAERATSWKEFSSMMSSMGVSASMHRRRDGGKEMDKVMLVARRGGALADSEYGDIDVALFNRLEASGRWRRSGRGRSAAPRALTADEIKEAKRIASEARAAQGRARKGATASTDSRTNGTNLKKIM